MRWVQKVMGRRQGSFLHQHTTQRQVYNHHRLLHWVHSNKVALRCGEREGGEGEDGCSLGSFAVTNPIFSSNGRNRSLISRSFCITSSMPAYRGSARGCCRRGPIPASDSCELSLTDVYRGLTPNNCSLEWSVHSTCIHESA